MDNIPEDILHTVYLNKHALEFHDTLEKISHIKPYVDYDKMDDENYDAGNIWCYDRDLENDFASIQSHADSDYDPCTDVSSVSCSRTDDLDEFVNDGAIEDEYEAEMIEQFTNAGNLSNGLKLKPPLLPLTNNRKICLDISCDRDYWFDEHYFDLPRKYGKDYIWERIEKKLNIQIIRKSRSRSVIPRRHLRYNKIWFIWKGALPILMCDMLHVVQTLNVKAQYDHRFLEIIHLSKGADYDNIELWCGS